MSIRLCDDHAPGVHARADPEPCPHRVGDQPRADPVDRVHSRAGIAGGVRKGAAFIFGWLASLAIVVAVTVLLTGNNPPRTNTAPSLAGLAVKILIGAVLLVIAWTPMAKTRSAETAEEDPEVADGHRQHVAVVRHGPGAADPALGTGRGRRRGHRGSQALELAGLSRALPVLRDRNRDLPHDGDLRRLQARPRPRPS